jgi:hypothetical protein
VVDFEFVQNLTIQALGLDLHDLSIHADCDEILNTDGLLRRRQIRFVDVVKRRAATAADLARVKSRASGFSIWGALSITKLALRNDDAVPASGAIVNGAVRGYTPGMRAYAVSALLILIGPLSAQVVPDGWQIVKDTRGVCQIAVPRDWSVYGESRSAAVLHDPSMALAVVTSQPGQAFAPLTERLQTVLNISKEKLFENSEKRIFFEDKGSAHPNDPKCYTFSVPEKGGTCSGHLTFLPGVANDIARMIALSLGPVPNARGGTQ